MDAGSTKLLVGLGLVGAGAVAFVLLRGGSAPAATTDQGAVQLPAAYQPETPYYGGVTFNLPALSSSASNYDAPTVPPVVLFDFVGGVTPPAVPPPPDPSSSSQPAGSADGATGPCNCPGASTQAYGSVADMGTAMGSFLQNLLPQLPAGVAEGNYWGVYQQAYGGATPLQTAVAMAKSTGQLANDASLALVNTPSFFGSLFGNA